MHILAWVLSGVAAGWLTGHALKGEGYGLFGNLLIGSAGGLVGGWTFEYGLGVTLGGGWVVHLLVASLGGMVLVGGVRVLDGAARRVRLIPQGTRSELSADLDAAVRKLGELERRVFSHVLRRTPVTRDPNVEFDQQTTFGQRVADRVATFGGSWTFIGLFLLMMAGWMVVNTREPRPFDPFPFILLNLVLSCLAALQAPVIMMSQNRQAARDRIDAHNDYQVNLNAEMQILALHTKVDELRDQQLLELIRVQQRQITLLEQLLARGSEEGRG